MAAKKKPEFLVVHVAVGALIPAVYNPRNASEKEVADVRESITRFGFVDPLVVNSRPARKNIVIGGHLRLAVAKEMGMEQVPVHYVDLDEARERELNLRLNRNTGSWDWDLLANFEPPVLLDAGFTLDELALHFDLDDGVPDADDTAPEVPVVPTSRTGDLWLLGEHRVLCGDATKAADYARALDGQLADCVWTDPPYNVNYEGGTGKTKRAKIANDNMTSGEFASFLRAFYEATIGSMRAGAPIYVAIPPGPDGVAFMVGMREAEFKFAQIVQWVKNALVFGRSDYHYKNDAILYGWKPGAAHTWHGGRDKTTVIECAKPSASPDHPTMKPIALVAEMLANSAVAGAVVLDPFGGSGTTLMACDALKMKARLVELDARYVDVIVTRWQAATGGVATLDGGKTFAQVAKQRAK